MTWRDFPFILIGVPLIVLALIIPNSILGLGISALLALYAFLSPKNGLLLLLLYFPTRPFLIEINPSLKMLGDLIIIAVFLQVVWLKIRQKEWKSLLQFHLFEWAFILFCIVGAVSALITGVTFGAIVFQLRAFLITFVLFYITRRLEIRREDVLKFLWTTFLMAILLCLHGIVEKLSMRTLLLPDDWVLRSLSHNNRVRIYGLIDNPNVLAVYLSIAFMLTLYLKQLLRGKHVFLFNISLILMLGVITLTYSRGTWIGFAIGLVIYAVLTKEWKRTRNILIGIVMAIVLVNIPVTKGTEFIKEQGFLSGVSLPPQKETDGMSDESRRLKESFEMSTIELSKTTGRLFIVTKGFEIFKDHPVAGSGFATFGDSAAKGYSSPIYKDYGIENDIYSDNQYIQVIAQTGSLGVLLFAVFLLGMLVYLWKKRTETYMAIPILAVLLGVYVCGLLYNIWEDKTFTTYFFLMLGAVAHTIDLKRTEGS